jgi:mannose-6-phosphate isomerase-like protein (cupin superfamily)
VEERSPIWINQGIPNSELEIVEAAINSRHFTFTNSRINQSNLMTQSFWFFGSRLNIIADHTTTSGQYDLIEGYFPPNTQTPLHRHTRYSEQLYVLEGEFTVWAGENKFVLSAGESFFIAPCTPHAIGVFNDQPTRGLVVAAPSSFARLIAAVGTLDETAAPDLALFERISAEIGDEILGPPEAYP